MESWVQSKRPRANFPIYVSKVLRLPGKKWCQVMRSAAPAAQNHLPKTEDLILQNAAPWPPNISDEHVSCTAPARRNTSWQILCKCPTPATIFGGRDWINCILYSNAVAYWGLIGLLDRLRGCMLATYRAYWGCWTAFGAICWRPTGLIGLCVGNRQVLLGVAGLYVGDLQVSWALLDRLWGCMLATYKSYRECDAQLPVGEDRLGPV